MARLLADILKEKRQQLFTGREKELALFKSIISKKQLNTFLLYMYGPGGQGKSTLLKAFIETCKDQDVKHLLLDARELNASPTEFIAILQTNLNIKEDITTALSGSDHFVLFIDTYELIRPIDDWLRQEFLPTLPDNVLTVLSGRNAPSKNWTMDAGWQELMEQIQIRNFSRSESKGYLKKRNVKDSEVDNILNFTHGHPLALSVVADTYQQDPDKHFNPNESPDIVRALLENFVQKVPSPAHRTALEICAIVHTATESLLKQVMEVEDASELFLWLRELSFIESNWMGIYPHDLARESVCAYLRWRNPDWNKNLHLRIRKYFIDRIDKAVPEEQRSLLYQLSYLHRHHATVRNFLEWQEGTFHWIDRMKPSDIPLMETMVLEHEGNESAKAFSFWVNHPASFVWVYRNAEIECSGFILRININELQPGTVVADPVMNNILKYGADHFNLRKGEVCTVFRFWMAADTYQNVSRLQSSAFLTIVQYYLSTPSLAVHLLGCVNPKFWEAILNYADLYHVSELDFQTEKNPYGFFMHDWRKVPPAAWLDILGQREIGEEVGTSEKMHLQVMVLSEDDFAVSVYEALKDFHDEKKLRNNPLLRSRFIIEKAETITDIDILLASLRDCLIDATDKVKESPKDEKLHRILFRTFFNPVGSQEQAADFLNIPFSTYRRYLRKAVNKVSNQLWTLELAPR